jgi:hypothetical protein
MATSLDRMAHIVATIINTSDDQKIPDDPTRVPVRYYLRGAVFLKLVPFTTNGLLIAVVSVAAALWPVWISIDHRRGTRLIDLNGHEAEPGWPVASWGCSWWVVCDDLLKQEHTNA